ncbi:MAG: hypothetical protein ABIR98_15580 [Usitatibacter sp.]
MAAQAATEIPPGKWSFVFSDAKGQADRPMRVYTYRPRKCDARCPIVFVMHGLNRTASRYRDYWELPADGYGVIVVAPEFNTRYWPKEENYNLGEVAQHADREKWAYSAIEHLFDEVRDGQNGYAIFGHSAGGQFVQRMAFFRPDNRATVMVAANAGYYLMPEWRKDKGSPAYPHSLVESKAGEGELRQALQRRLIVMLGEKDVDPDHKHLNKSAGAMKQGANRLERGENFFKTATAAAGDLGVKLGWELVEVPDVAHSGEQMSKAAARTLYGKK